MKYLPLIIWSALIFSLSARPTSPVSEAEDLNVLFFKFAHLVVYAILYMLAVAAFHRKTQSIIKTYFLAFLYTALFALSDELHQLFVPNRSGRVSDIFIDLVGATCAYFALRYLKLLKA